MSAEDVQKQWKLLFETCERLFPLAVQDQSIIMKISINQDQVRDLKELEKRNSNHAALLKESK